MFASLSLRFTQTPPFIKAFLIKGLLFFIFWKILYLAFLLPGRVLDGPLTYAVGKVTTKALAVLYPGGNFSTSAGIFKGSIEGVEQTEAQMNIYSSGKNILSVADGCNGLELFVLYAGFIICLPFSLKRKTIFLLCGIVMIFCINIIRCTALTVIALHYPRYLNFSHHYIFTFLVYSFVFLLWMAYTKKLSADGRFK